MTYFALMDDWKNIEVQNLHKKFPSLNADLVETLTKQLLNRITEQLVRKSARIYGKNFATSHCKIIRRFTVAFSVISCNRYTPLR